MIHAYEELQVYLERAMALQTANILFEWDSETLAPQGGGELTAKMVGSLSEEYQRIMTDEALKKLLETCEKELEEHPDAFSEKEQAILRETREEVRQLTCIPPQEYRTFSELTAKATGVWAKAKEEKDFSQFAPTLKEIISYQKKFASYRAKAGQKLYNVMLDDYEKGFGMNELDEFFDKLKEKLVPLLREIKENGKNIPDKFLRGNYPEEKQEKLARAMAAYLGFDFSKGVLSVSAHPFTTNLHNHDVRMTTHYTDRVDSSLFSVIHETGHALYELGIADELTQTLVGQGASMGMHESQSRFFENMLGRNPAFWEPLYGMIQQMFPEKLGKVSLKRFVRAVNRVEPGLIRTEADELSYSLHVLIRYELEKQLIEENLDVEQLPQLWADKYEEYLGVRPQNDAEGVLQDIHWSQGSFGYFPSYALGSAFAAQIYAFMEQQMDVDGLLREGKVDTIRDYLRTHIHQYGKLRTSRKLLKDMTGEDFNPQYYIDYLTKKYKKLYGIEA